MFLYGDFLELPHNEIHFWIIDDSKVDIADFEKNIGYLCIDEVERRNKFYFDEHKSQYLVSRIMLRSILSKYDSQIKPHQWSFYTNKHGRPFIKNTCIGDSPAIYFSLSHTRNRVVLLISRFEIAGVDIEITKNNPEILKISNKYFSASEIQALEELSEKQQLTRFYQLWTLKESYIKACGIGLSIPLNSFSFHLQDNNKINIEFEKNRVDDSLYWKFWQFNTDGPYEFSAAVKNIALDMEIFPKHFLIDKTSGYFEVKLCTDMAKQIL